MPKSFFNPNTFVIFYFKNYRVFIAIIPFYAVNRLKKAITFIKFY